MSLLKLHRPAHRWSAAAAWIAARNAANCAACHTQSDQGDFNEHNVRIPR